MKRLPVHGLDPASGVDGQVPVISGGKFVIGDAPGGSGSPSAGFNPAAGRSPRIAPFGVKLRGANLVPQSVDDDAWAVLYSNWATKWDTLIRPQIDAMASIGANAIRLIGDVGGVQTAVLTTDDYVAAYEQFVDYCANLGLYVYAVLSDARHWEGATKDQALVTMLAQAEMLETKPNVLCIDAVQELGLYSAVYSGETMHDFAAYLLDALRDVTTLPLTCSHLPNVITSSLWSSSTTADFADIVDFYDMHPYYDGLTVSDLAPFLADLNGKPALFGEYGADATAPARYAAAAEASALEEIVGSFAWSAIDNGSTPTDGQGGLFDYDFDERTILTEIFRTVPDREGFHIGGPIVEDDGNPMPTRARLNFVGATLDDDADSDATIVTIPDSTLTVQEDGVDVEASAGVLNFGNGFDVAAADGTVTITLASSSTGELLMQDGVTAPPVPVETEAQDDWLYQD